MAAYVELIKRKFNIRSWLLRHLISARMGRNDVAKIYSTVIRPALEYAAPVYGPLLNQASSDEIEKLQRRSMKMIFGHKTSYKDTLPTLEERRKEIIKKFALKLAANQKFDHWLPKHQPYNYKLRNVLRYEEEASHTDRLYRSPIFTFRRLLNNEL